MSKTPALSASLKHPNLPPLAVYVHVPWCVRKCPYCDFNSHAASKDDIPVTDYLQRIQEDILQDAPLAQGRVIQSIFFGGGTPSLLPAQAIHQILEWLREHVGFSSDIEITLEANPGTFEADKFSGYHAAGVNRLSIGVQSFQDTFLTALGRIHTADNAIAAIKQAKAVGFDDFNIDLMHGLPNQNESQALYDLEKAIELTPTHISWYQLTIEQNTEFFSHRPTLPDDDVLWDIQQAGQSLLARHGFQQYEVSAYSLTGKQSRHNLNYWQYGDYLGLGPGAHGKFTRIGELVDIVRTRKTRLPKDYLNNSRPLLRMEEPVGFDDRPFDFFMNAFRLKQSVDLTEFEQLTGLSVSAIEPKLTQLKNQGWITWRKNKVATTDQGYLYLNDVLSYWLD